MADETRESVRETVDTGRRDFLKKSIAAGAVVWSAPVVTSLPGGKAWAAPYPCPNPAGPCTGTAYGLRIQVASLVVGPIPSAPGPSPTCLINPAVPPIINLAATVCGDADTTACRFDGYIENLDLDIASALGLPLLSVQASVLRATASVSGDCPPCSAFGSSIIAGLVVNGGAINVTSPCNTTIPVLNPPLNLANVFLNEQTCDANGVLTVNAVRITVPAVGIEVILGHAEAGRTGCDCVTCT